MIMLLEIYPETISSVFINCFSFFLIKSIVDIRSFQNFIV